MRGHRRSATPRAYDDVVARPAHYEDAGVRIDKLIVGPFENNVFVVRCKRTGDAVLLDAANEHELLLEVCRETGVRRVLTTHGHWDHIQAVEAVRDAGHRRRHRRRDAEMLPGYDFVIPDDEVYEVGDLRLRSIHTPGHTAGSTSFLLEGKPIVFTGDTLFPGGPGNTEHAGRELRPDHRVDRPPPVHAARPTRSCSPATVSTPPSAKSAPTSRSGPTAAGSRFGRRSGLVSCRPRTSRYTARGRGRAALPREARRHARAPGTSERLAGVVVTQQLDERVRPRRRSRSR